MENKIILISNRGVRPNRTGKTLFKNKMTSSAQRLRCAEVNVGGGKKKYSLALQSEGSEQAFIKDQVSSGNDRPWVFFVHGNNQTLDKNLKKCFGLRDLYDVNVLAFSWPSTHQGKFFGLLGYLPFQPSVGKYITRQLKRKLKQYGKARKNAADSAKDLVDSLLMFKSAIEGTGKKCNFVCHSLGHRVLKLSNDHQSLGDTLAPFEHVLLHQADEDNDGHKDWVNEIDKGDKVFVTTNEKDKVLELSNLYNHKSLKNQRLGNVPKPNEPQPPSYKDFTGMGKLGLSGHTMFLRPASKSPEVHAFFRPIIGGPE